MPYKSRQRRQAQEAKRLNRERSQQYADAALNLARENKPIETGLLEDAKQLTKSTDGHVRALAYLAVKHFELGDEEEGKRVLRMAVQYLMRSLHEQGIRD